jgi:hypothetical protein
MSGRAALRSVQKIIAPVLATLALASLPLTGSACGSSGDQGQPQGKWETVLTTELSGQAPVKLNLGTHQLGSQVRLAWDLTGPQSPPVTLTFRLINADYGTGFGFSSRPTDQGFETKTENAMTIAPIKPGNFTVYFSQRFPQAQGPGYGGTLTVYTLK